MFWNYEYPWFIHLLSILKIGHIFEVFRSSHFIKHKLVCFGRVVKTIWQDSLLDLFLSLSLYLFGPNLFSFFHCPMVSFFEATILEKWGLLLLEKRPWRPLYRRKLSYSSLTLVLCNGKTLNSNTLHTRRLSRVVMDRLTLYSIFRFWES